MLIAEVGKFESCAASQHPKINRINYLREWLFDALLSLVSSVTCDAQAALDDVRNWLRQCLSRSLADYASEIESSRYAIYAFRSAIFARRWQSHARTATSM